MAAQQAPQRNPFMLMLNPEMVLAAVANSERLGQLNRRLCRPLDRPGPDGLPSTESAADEEVRDSAKVRSA